MNILMAAGPAAISGSISTLPQMTLAYAILQRVRKKQSLQTIFLRCIVISLPGVNSHAKLTKTDKSGRSVLDFLKTLGCKSAVVAYDADKNVNEHVHRHEKN